MVQVQSLGDRHAWVCSLDEEFLGWGCVKVPLNKIKQLQTLKYTNPVSAGQKRRRDTYEATTNEHKVFVHVCH